MNDQAAQLRQAMRSAAGAPVIDEHVPASRAIGAISFGPAPHAPARLRSRRAAPPAPSRISLAKAIAVSSGKGGVGKSNLAVNLAVAMSRMKLKVCLLDADLGLANADVLCNITPKMTLEHVVAGECRLWEAMVLGPGGFRLIPGASGVAKMADLSEAHRRGVLEQLALLERIADVIIIDTGAGIHPNVLSFAAAAHSVVLTTTPEPTSITDGYGTIKTLVAREPQARIELVVNMATSEQEAAGVFARIDRVSRTFLHRPLSYGGAIPNDPAVPASVRQRVPFALYAPESDATRAVWAMARRLAGLEGVESSDQSANKSANQRGFFARLANWLGNGGGGENFGR